MVTLPALLHKGVAHVLQAFNEKLESVGPSLGEAKLTGALVVTWIKAVEGQHMFSILMGPGECL